MLSGLLAPEKCTRFIDNKRPNTNFQLPGATVGSSMNVTESSTLAFSKVSGKHYYASDNALYGHIGHTLCKNGTKCGDTRVSPETPLVPLWRSELVLVISGLLCVECHTSHQYGRLGAFFPCNEVCSGCG